MYQVPGIHVNLVINLRGMLVSKLISPTASFQGGGQTFLDRILVAQGSRRTSRSQTYTYLLL